MILGVGIDIVEVDRIKDTYERFGSAFLKRGFTSREVDVAFRRNGLKRIETLASRFSAKEAFAKALGTGIGNNAFLREIEIQNDESGKPFITVYGRTKETLESLIPKGKKAKIHLSISDTKKLAETIVFIEAI